MRPFLLISIHSLILSAILSKSRMNNNKTDVIIIGAPKCGTTTLFQMLKCHEGINACRIKEPAFFASWDGSQSQLSKYHDLWNPKNSGMRLEASPHYAGASEARKSMPKTLYDYNPELKLIYLVRHPLDRSMSDYYHKYKRRRTDRLIDDALTDFSDRNQFVHTSKYSIVYPRFSEYFGPDQMKILKFDDLVSQPQELYNEVCSFIGLQNKILTPFELRPRNRTASPLLRKWLRDIASSEKRMKLKRLLPDFIVYESKKQIELPVPSEQTINLFFNRMRQYVEKLEEFTNWDLDHWKAIQQDHDEKA